MKQTSRLKKQLLAGTLLLLTLFLFSSQIAMASITGTLFSWVAGGVMTAFGGALGSAIGWVVYVINYIVATIFGVAISIMAYFIGVMLQLNTHVTDSQAVQTGFKITLALANLGFVIAIIVMAIGTILRYESYTVKKMLPKLVAAAILVNFSLVIAGTILNFADQMSLFFLKQTAPSGTDIFYGFPGKLAGAFGPQRVFYGISDFPKSTGTGASQVGTGGLSADDYKRLQGGAQSLASIFVPLLNLFFPTLFLIVMVITLFALWIMLLVRYIFLGILLILMPFVWLLWLFPPFKSHWDKWWHNFIRWTFFSPIVIFFLYLALTVADGMNQGNWQGTDPGNAVSSLGYKAPNGTGAASTIIAGASTIMGSFVNNVIGSGLQMAMMLGLVIGGLFAANSMGITFASTALGATKGLGKTMGKWAASKGLEYGGAPLRKKIKTGGLGAPIKEMSRAERLQERVGKIKNPAFRYAASWVARGATRVSTISGQDQVERYAKMASAMKTPDLATAIPTVFGAKFAAYMNELGKRKHLDESKNADLSHGEKTEALFKNLGMKDDYEKNVEKTSGFSSEAYEAMKRGASQQEINNIMAKFAEKWGRGDPANMQLSDLHSGTAGKFGLTDDAIKKMAKANAYGFAAAAPHLVASALQQMKTKSLNNFAGGSDGGGDYREGLDKAEQTGAITAPEWIRRQDQFNRIIVNNVLYAGAGTPGSTAPPPPPPPNP